MLDEQVAAHQIVHRDIEEALDLGGVQVHGQHPVSAGGSDQVGDKLGGDGVTALGFTVLTGIAKVRDHGGHAAGRGPAHGIDHDQKLHQVVIHMVAGGLNDENILASDRLGHGDGTLAVCKLGDVGAA